MDSLNTPSSFKLRQQIGIVIFFAASGQLVPLLIEIVFEIDLSKSMMSIIAFLIFALVILLFPRVFGIPFGKLPIREFFRKIGLYIPQDTYKHVILGTTLALCTLTGMLVGSLLTGKYVVDFANITIDHALFSLVPGVWEEVFYRGILMILLLKTVKRLELAFAIQCIIFGLLHIRSVDLAGFIDVLSVMIIAIGFTYAVYKTNSLLAAMVFHYLHDALLFFVLIPGGEYTGPIEIAMFYIPLWIMVGTGLLITKFASEKFRFNAGGELLYASYYPVQKAEPQVSDNIMLSATKY
ncbi:MAG: CPBP family intramembrane glutamic endopeptidase [Candidatus Odinarchaeota archaeon]